MRRTPFAISILALLLVSGVALAETSIPSEPPLGLPEVPTVVENPMTPEKVELGEKLFNDKRFSTTGEVSCATCHAVEKAFTDGPLAVSEGINKLTGTRNAPTVINSAYFETMFWDGRSPSLEDQALHPFVNPVEMGLTDHQPILEIVRTDSDYKKQFDQVFGVQGGDITMDHVTKAIATFERTIIAGNSPFDRYWFAGEKDALTAQQKEGFELFVNKGRCVSCHVVEETQALFTDNKFHNIGVGINRIQDDVDELATEFLAADATLAEVDQEVLTDVRTSELGRFAITHGFDGLGAFKTPTLRNVAVTAPYMHDGSLKTLRETVEHYNNGGVTPADAPVNDFLSGGIRPLDLTESEIDALVAFMEALTSPEFAELAQTPDASASGK